jgi:hypothetical protein
LAGDWGYPNDGRPRRHESTKKKREGKMLRIPSQLSADLESLVHQTIGCCIADIARVLSYLRVSGMRVGLLINFNVPVLQDGIKRIVL